MQRQVNAIRALLRECDGASAAEYAMILAIIGGALAVSAFLLGQAIGTGINRVATCISTAGGTCN